MKDRRKRPLAGMAMGNRQNHPLPGMAMGNRQKRLLAGMAMGNRWKRPLAALALAVGMVLALPVFSSMVWAVDVEKPCSLTVNPCADSDDAGSMKAGLENADVVIDLYKIADAKADAAYDTYGYELTAAYKGLEAVDGFSDLTKLANDDWRDLAQKAAELTLDADKASGQIEKIAKTVDGAKAGTEIDLAGEGKGCGLYLLIARGEGEEDYVTKVTDESDEDGGERIATVAYDRENGRQYAFSPELVSLPTKGAGADGTVSTANSGEWIYDPTVTLKPSESEVLGSLEIVKNLLVYENSSKTTFVFQIEAEKDIDRDGKPDTVYSDVAALTFDGAGQKTIRIEDKIPVGATVTVTEVYSGASYELAAGDSDSKTTVILMPDDAEGPAKVEFTNTYNEENKGGYGIVNHFSKTDGHWDNEQKEDNAAQ